MSIFGKIKDAIFGHKPAAPAPAPQPAPASRPAMPQMNQPAQRPVTPPPAAKPAPAPAAPAQAVDVEHVLADIAKAKGNPDLNYRSSIVDLMKLLDLDSSLDNRKELATELGYSGAKDGSAEMNIWLHKAVMRELEKNGGTVPAALKD